MRFSEFETASDKGARVYKKKEADKDREAKQRESARKNFNAKVVKKVTSGVLAKVYQSLSQSDGKFLQVSTIGPDITDLL